MYKAGNCYKKKRKCKMVKRYKPCWKTKLVKRYRLKKYTCTKWKNVRVRRRKLRYRVGKFCTKKVKKRFTKVVTVLVPRVYYVKVRRWKWKTKTVMKLTPVWRWRLVRRSKYVVRYRTVKRFVRAVRRVLRKVWTTVPAFRYVRYTVKKLRRTNVRVRYSKKVNKWRTLTRRVCFKARC